jgi:hypothetical protein
VTTLAIVSAVAVLVAVTMVALGAVRVGSRDRHREDER